MTTLVADTNNKMNDEDGVGHLNLKSSVWSDWIEDNPRYTKDIHRWGFDMPE
jgi:hypothetical protein